MNVDNVSHGLVCLLHDNPIGSFRSLRAGGITSASEITADLRDKMSSVYHDNVTRLQALLHYLSVQGYTSYRVSSSLFPLMTHGVYATVAQRLFDTEIFERLSTVDTYGIELSTHPGQFTLLTSVNQHVNDNSLKELELWAKIAEHLPINVVNIHGGSKRDGFDHHRRIFESNVNRLSPAARRLLSLENDEKSYSATEIATLCQSHGLMMVLDYHHERCFQRKAAGLDHITVDAALTEANVLCQAIMTYNGRAASPLAHLSSPRGGWADPDFRNLCAHADYIDPNDYPLELLGAELSETLRLAGHNRLRLDIEAKHKQVAIQRLNEWKNNHEH